MGLYSGNTYWGSATLASMEAAPAATRLFTNKWGASGGAACTTTSGDGCLHAGATRTLGRIRLGGLPATFISGGAAPVGWDPANYLVEFTSLTDQVDAESGVGAATPTATRSGSLKYWNGSGYTTVALGAATPAPVTLPSVVVSEASGTGTLQVTMSGTITFGALSTATTLPAGCTTICTARATSESPAVANITYTATNGGSTLAYLVISMDLANLEVETKYRAAPSAG